MYKNLVEKKGNVINIVTVLSKENGKKIRRPIVIAVWEQDGCYLGVRFVQSLAEISSGLRRLSFER